MATALVSDATATDAVVDLVWLCLGGSMDGDWRPRAADLAPIWEPLVWLAERARLGPALYACWRRHPAALQGLPLPPEWQVQYLARSARNVCALRQLHQVAAAFRQRQVRLMALKGSATLLGLYPDLGCREISDLDLLVEQPSAEEAVDIMTGLGYEMEDLAPGHTAEQERITVQHVMRDAGHLPCFHKPEAMPVEIHVRILRNRHLCDASLPDLWSQSVTASGNCQGLLALSPAHALMHAMLHFLGDLERRRSHVKGLLDMLLILRTHGPEIDWEAFWRAARRWHVHRDVATIAATLHHHWGVGVPGTPPEATPLTAWDLLHGLPEPTHKRVAAVLWTPLDQLLRMRELPDLRSRLRYLWGLLFPSARYLRARYGVPEGRSVAPYYLLRFILVPGGSLRELVAAARGSRRPRDPHDSTDAPRH